MFFGEFSQMLRNMRDREASESARSKLKELDVVKKNDWAMGAKDEEPECVKMHIYNFLVTEGHLDIAQTFAKESGLPTKLIKHYKDSPYTKPEVTAKRLQIKSLIKNGEIDTAISKIEAYQQVEADPITHEEIIFSLLCLKVINLIREVKLQEAIQTGREKLLPLTQKHPERVSILEKVMSLIAFVDVRECQHSEFLSSNYKNDLAEEVNVYLLGKSNTGSLKTILNINKWLQKRLDCHLTFPHLNPWSNQLYQQ